MRLLIAEDDERVVEALGKALRAEGFDVDATGDGAEACYLAERTIHDLIVLDIIMPSMSGLDVVRSIRSRGIDTPIILTTAKDGVKDRVAGLDLGADDYLVKPYALSELIARINALLRRCGNDQQDIGMLSCGPLSLDTRTHGAYMHGRDLHLTQKEYEIAEFLVMNKGRIITRGQLIERLWEYETDLGMSILDVHIHNLRKKLKTSAEDAPVIRTIRRVGFMLEAASPETDEA